jgi:hypothetical protein
MPLTPAFAEVLRGGRAEFNRRFAVGQQRHAGIDPAAFGELLGGPIDAIIGKVARVDSAAVPLLVDTLYDLTLTLLGQRWIGPGARAPAIIAGWDMLAESAPALLARQPVVLSTAIANALVHWSTHGGGDDWLATLGMLARRARDADELLHAGQVAAWRHGMAHYRDGALERARRLDRELLALALGVSFADWQDSMLARLLIDRWYRPDQPPAPTPRVAGEVGAFVGFGGRFAEPPLAVRIDGEVLLHSAGSRYSLHADAYGCSVQACGEGTPKPSLALPDGWRIEGGVLIGRRQRFGFTERGGITSAACSDDMLVLTHAWSHAATVVALA